MDSNEALFIEVGSGLGVWLGDVDNVFIKRIGRSTARPIR